MEWPIHSNKWDNPCVLETIPPFWILLSVNWARKLVQKIKRKISRCSTQQHQSYMNLNKIKSANQKEYRCCVCTNTSHMCVPHKWHKKWFTIHENDEEKKKIVRPLINMEFQFYRYRSVLRQSLHQCEMRKRCDIISVDLCRYRCLKTSFSGHCKLPKMFNAKQFQLNQFAYR